MSDESRKEWMDPGCVSVNKLYPRSSFTPIESPLENFQTKRVFGLDSSEDDWKFKWFPNVKSCLSYSSLTSKGINIDDSWRSINVPGNWELQKHPEGFPIYTNIGYPFAGAGKITNPPEIEYQGGGKDKDYNPSAIYHRHILLPEDFIFNTNDQVFLHIGGVTSCIYVLINKEMIGYSQDSKLPCEFNITPYLLKAENKKLVEIEFVVITWCDGSYLEDQDMWHLSGITREVFLYSRPQAFIQDFTTKASLTNANEFGKFPSNDANGELDITVTIQNVPETAATMDEINKKLQIHAELYDDTENSNVLMTKNQLIGCTRFIGDSNGVTLSFKMKSFVKPWSAEAPHLYRLSLTLYLDEDQEEDGTVGDDDTKSKKTKLLECVQTNVGFRNVEVCSGRLLVNGVAVTLRGVNRHEHDAVNGHVMEEAAMRRDVELMKKFNFNAVRCSHYPAHPKFYDLCDRLGLYVVDEANIESHGIGFEKNTLADRTDYGAAHLERVIGMFERDKNHASVIIWSLGNEAGNGINFHRCYSWLKKHDPSRPVQYENARIQPIWSQHEIETIDENTDIYVPMYPSPSKLRKYGEKFELNPRAIPLIMCEYSHAMGNSCGGFKQYWDVIHEFGVLQGGFIWDWCDQGLQAELSDWTVMENTSITLLKPVFQSKQFNGNLEEAQSLCNEKGYGGFILNTEQGVCSYYLERATHISDVSLHVVEQGSQLHVAPKPVVVNALHNTKNTIVTSKRPLFCYGSDFGPFKTPEDYNFCINGLVQPDRYPNPHLWEVKHVQRPVAFTTCPLDITPISRHAKPFTPNRTQNQLWVWNRYDFTELSPNENSFTCHGTVSFDGVSSIEFDVILPKCEAQHRTLVELPLNLTILTKHSSSSLSSSVGDDSHVLVHPYKQECYLTLRLLSSVDGSEISWDQFDVDPGSVLPKPATEPSATTATMKRSDTSSEVVVNVVAGEHIELVCDQSCYIIDEKDGLLKSITKNGIELLSSSMKPNFWRALTDNEFGWGAEKKLKVWKDAGLPISAGGSLDCTSVEVSGNVVTSHFDLCHNGTKLSVNYEIRKGDQFIVTSTLSPTTRQTYQRGQGLIPGSTVVLQNMRTGRHLDVENTSIQARWNDAGDWQRFEVVEGFDGKDGQVSLISHTGCYLESSKTDGQDNLFVHSPRNGEYGIRLPLEHQSFEIVKLDNNDNTLIQLKASNGSFVTLLSNSTVSVSASSSHTNNQGNLWRVQTVDTQPLPPLKFGFVVPLNNTEDSKTSHVQWFGRGPHESYIDRKAGAAVGLYSGSVVDQVHAYVRPQETGCKSETRWMGVGDKDMTKGLIATMCNDSDQTPLSAPLHVTVLPFHPDYIDAFPVKEQQRPCFGAQIVPQSISPLTSLLIDCGQDGAATGVGGIDSWGAPPLFEHRPQLSEPRTWSFRLKTFDVALDGPLEQLARVNPRS